MPAFAGIKRGGLDMAP